MSLSRGVCDSSSVAVDTHSALALPENDSVIGIRSPVALPQNLPTRESATDEFPPELLDATIAVEKLAKRQNASGE